MENLLPDFKTCKEAHELGFDLSCEYVWVESKDNKRLYKKDNGYFTCLEDGHTFSIEGVQALRNKGAEINIYEAPLFLELLFLFPRNTKNTIGNYSPIFEIFTSMNYDLKLSANYHKNRTGSVITEYFRETLDKNTLLKYWIECKQKEIF